MFPILVLFIFIDLIGKLIWASTFFRELIFSILFLVAVFFVLLKLFQFFNKHPSKLQAIMHNMFFWCSYLIVAIPFTANVLERVLRKYEMLRDYYAAIGTIFTFVNYFLLSLIIIYLLSHMEDIVDFIRSTWASINVIILYSVIVALIMIVTELFAAIFLYYSSYKSYNAHVFREKVKASSVEQQVSPELIDDLIYLSKSSLISKDHFLELADDMEDIYTEQKNTLPEKLETEIAIAKMKTDDEVIPPLQVLMILFKFSFYQHYVLGLDDHLTGFQKYIASYLNTSSLQMVHIIFIRIIDLIIIGKIIAFIVNRNERSLTVEK